MPVIESKNTEQNIILVGNPNTGKSTLFNSLTGLNQKVGGAGVRTGALGAGAGWGWGPVRTPARRRRGGGRGGAGRAERASINLAARAQCNVIKRKQECLRPAKTVAEKSSTCIAPTGFRLGQKQPITNLRGRSIQRLNHGRFRSIRVDSGRFGHIPP